MSINDFEKLYMQYKPFLCKLCRRYVGFCEFDDLMQISYIALHKAATTFKIECGATFQHYLALCVKRSVLREIDNNYSIVRIPVHVQAMIREYKLTKERLTHELLRAPLTEEIAGVMNQSVKAIEKIESTLFFRNAESLDAVITDDGDTALIDIIPDTADELIDSAIERHELQNLLWQAAKNCLDDDVYDFVCDYYRDEMTLRDIAANRGVHIVALRKDLQCALRRLHNDRIIRQLGTDYGYDSRYRHVTLSEYRTSWTSTVELEVLKREEYQERLSHDLDLAINNYNPFATISDYKSQEGSGT